MTEVGQCDNTIQLKITKDEFLKTLLTLKDFVNEGQYYYSVVDEVAINPEVIDIFLED